MEGSQPNAILVDGSLDEKKTRVLTEKVAAALSRGEAVILVLNSGGGVFSPNMEELVRKIHTADVPTKAVIYCAGSVATALALACKERVIDREGVFIFHYGVIQNVSTVSVNADGMLAQPLRERLQKAEQLLKELIEASTIQLEGQDTDRLSASGMLPMNAEQCVQAGIAQKIV